MGLGGLRLRTAQRPESPHVKCGLVASFVGPEQKPGGWQLISRVGAGFLMPHAQNKIFGKENQVDPKDKNIWMLEEVFSVGYLF